MLFSNEKKNFSFRVVDLWNSLPAEVVESPNIDISKNRLNYHWKDNPIKFYPSFVTQKYRIFSLIPTNVL